MLYEIISVDKDINQIMLKNVDDFVNNFWVPASGGSFRLLHK